MARPILDSTNGLWQTPVKQVVLIVESLRTEIIQWSKSKNYDT